MIACRWHDGVLRESFCYFEHCTQTNLMSLVMKVEKAPRWCVSRTYVLSSRKKLFVALGQWRMQKSLTPRTGRCLKASKYPSKIAPSGPLCDLHESISWNTHIWLDSAEVFGLLPHATFQIFLKIQTSNVMLNWKHAYLGFPWFFGLFVHI